MKKRIKIELHTQIIIALVLGAIFGSFFKIDHNQINIFYGKDSVKLVDLSQVSQASIINKIGLDTTFIQNPRLKDLIKYNAQSQVDFILTQNNRDVHYANIKSLELRQTIATSIKPIGDLFIRLLSFIAIPLVLSTLIVGAGSLDDVKKLGRIGLKTFVLFISTTMIAIIIGLILANIIQPGSYITEDTKVNLLTEFTGDVSQKLANQGNFSLTDFFLNIVPKNPFEAIATGDMLQIVFFAVFIGISLTFVKDEFSKPVLSFFNGLSEVMLVIVHFVMKLAPYGVFALIAATVASFGFNIISTLLMYIITVLLGLVLQVILVYGLLIKVFTKRNFFDLIHKMKDAMVIAFSTSSSAATLPVTMDCVENKLKVPNKIAGFVLPLGVTMNMDGTALYQGVATIFIAQIYGMDLSITAQLTIIITAVLASIGTAPVPGVGIIMLVMILNSVNIPAEGIALIIGVDRLLDMARTISNILGDSSVAVVVSDTEK
ncbi:MAG TPA: dicarboxylate/amino acid:cation symporter [Candidatus Kapabacteria bacterium]|nr:dicarboxylate/amino acid:cation symporter [Candidatus Kapabacteria bacterium]